jgi:hypothetical protein
VALLATRQALLASGGYESLIATPEDFDEKLHSDKFDLVILSAMLSQEEKRHIQAKLSVGTRQLVCWRHRCGRVNCCAWWPRRSHRAATRRTPSTTAM